MIKYIKAYLDTFVELLTAFGAAFLVYYVLLGKSFFADYAMYLVLTASLAGPLKLVLQKKDI